MYNLDELNEVQKKAVYDTEGAVLVTAGAGSGKTRLLTHRIAHLIKDLGVKPYNILAITFTNKAANEMKSRLEDMVNIDGLWVFTFHAMCVRFLRHFAEEIGMTPSFSIYDENDKTSVIKRVCKELDYLADDYKEIMRSISRAKNAGYSAEEYSNTLNTSEMVARAYQAYEKAMLKNNALDYDDLLIKAHHLLKTSETAREYYADKFRYIHIDEFQDTNTIQYDIAKILASKHKNIFAVGDEDQCIYTWRGATIQNIFDFKRDFNAKIYKLEQNYRSTNNVVTLANRIIKINTQRIDKRLWTDAQSGENVDYFPSRSESDEADFVVRTILSAHRKGVPFGKIAILMRLNALSRPFEEKLIMYNVPHKVYGGFKFYDRKEIKDIVAYLRLVVNPADDEAFLRMVTFPRRGIGDTTLRQLAAYGKVNGLSLFESVRTFDDDAFKPKTAAKFKQLRDIVESLMKAESERSITEFLTYLTNEVIDTDAMFDGDSDEMRTKRQNITELIASAHEFERNNVGCSLEDYLHAVTLYSDLDEMNEGDDTVTLATVHSAKGLEFDTVFIVGLEEGIFPIVRQETLSLASEEEERRLMYVAITRARKKLYLSSAESRFLRGERTYQTPSRFLSEGGFASSYQSRRYSGSFDQSDYYDEYRGRSVGYASANSESRGHNRFEHNEYGDPFDTYGDGDGMSRAEKEREVQRLENERIYKSLETTEKSDYMPVAATKLEQKKSSIADRIKVGTIVKHKTFGQGRVVSIGKMSVGVSATIVFEKVGSVMLAVDYAPIEIVE